MDKIDIIDAQVKDANENMRRIETIYKSLFKTYTMFKEGSAMMDEFDFVLGYLIEELPSIQKNIDKLSNKSYEFKALFKEGIADNLNYEPGFCVKEGEIVESFDKDALKLVQDVA